MKPVSTADLSVSPLAHVGGQEWQTQANVFDEMYTLFLVLGTLVGVVVIAYMLHKAYKYREGREVEDDGFDAPTVGELPIGADKGGKKVFVSFTISAVIVVSIVAVAYSSLLYVEAGPTEELSDEDVLEIDVEAYAFGWSFIYPNGEDTSRELVVPQGKAIDLNVTSMDVWHTFSVRELRIKSDAIPGQTSEEWFIAEETGEYRAVCDELCGSGHSQMNGQVTVLPEDEFLDWYEEELDGNRSEVYGGDIDNVGGVEPSAGEADDGDEMDAGNDSDETGTGDGEETGEGETDDGETTSDDVESDEDTGADGSSDANETETEA